MKKNLFMALMFLAYVTAVMASTSASRDTIVMRPDHFYFDEWYDTNTAAMSYQPPHPCPVNLFYRGIGRSGLLICSQHTNSRLKVKGLAVMAEDYVEHPHGYGARPEEYLYIFQFDASAPDSMVVLDSVRYDNVTPRTIAIPHCKEPEIEYTDVYEVYFKDPIYVDSIFYIGTSGHCQGNNLDASWMPLIFRPIWCPRAINHNTYKLHYPDVGWIDGMGGLPNWIWGPLFAIVDNHNLDAMADSAGRGTVAGGGRFADSSFNTITALPDYGYRFVQWNDGNRDNPRLICLTQDTLFTASFTLGSYYILNTESNNTEWGQVTGSETFAEQQPITITATPTWGYKFSAWSDGVTDNPRVVYLTQDTLFTAIFDEATYYTLSTVSEHPTWGYVEGAGVYPEQQLIAITAIPYTDCGFLTWNDGTSDNPRTIYLTQDTLLEAIFWTYHPYGIPGIETAEASFEVSPNPAHDIVTVSFGNVCDRTNASLVLRNAIGKIILSITPTANKVVIPLQGFSAGVYLLTLTTPQGSSTQRLVVE